MDGTFYVKAAAFIGAAIAMGIGTIGPALGQGFIGMKSCENIGKYPENSDKIRTTMILALAITETSAIYAFIVALLLIFVPK
ncbi:ATP synthase F0 subunit C [Candidatus Dependentiae bacterium]